jgi:hypothetical protein
MTNNFTAGDVLKVLPKLTRNMLSLWQGRGQVKPKVQAEGQGTRNEYSFENVCQIELFRRLIKEKFSRHRASEFAFAKNTESAFKLIRALDHGKNQLAIEYYSGKVVDDEEIGIEWERNPMTGESSGKRVNFKSPRIKMVFFRSGEYMRSSFFDEKNFDHVRQELMISDTVFIIDLYQIYESVKDGFLRAGIRG